MTPDWVVYGQNLSFGLKPENPNIGYFQFTMYPGETRSDAVILLNYDEKPQNFLILPVDGYTADGGGIAYSFDHPNKLSNWVKTDGNGKYKLLGSRIQRVPFTVTIPDNTPPGEYYLGFLTALDESEATPEPTLAGTQQSFRIKVVAQVAIAIVITIPGPNTCDVRVTDVQQSILSGKWHLNTHMINAGNKHFAGTGDIIISNKANDEITYKRTISVGYFLPGTEMNYSNDFDFPENGEYQVRYLISDNEDSSCKMTFTKDISIGEEIKEVFVAQVTKIAISQNTPTPTPPSTELDTTIHKANNLGTPMWIFWLSSTVFLFGAGLAIFAISTIRRHK